MRYGPDVDALIVELVDLSARKAYSRIKMIRRLRVIVKISDCTDNGVHESYEPIISPRAYRFEEGESPGSILGCRFHRDRTWQLIATDRTGSDSSL